VKGFIAEIEELLFLTDIGGCRQPIVGICMFQFMWVTIIVWFIYIFSLLSLHWEPSYSVVFVVLEVVSESLVEVSGKGTILLVNVGPLQSFIVVSSCVTLFHWWVGTSCAS